MNNSPINSTRGRIRIVYAVIIFICAVFVFRLFYLQVIKHNYYQTLASENQLKRYSIPAERGIIYAMDGTEMVPLVLNERRYNIVADPQIIKDKDDVALKLADVLKMDKDEIAKKLNTESRYEILAKKQTKEVKEEIEKLYASGEISGVFSEKTVLRVYPQGALAAQTIGFVDDEGRGKYGIEEYLDDQLSGTPGKVKALTDQDGIPLLASGENVLEDPVDGEDIVLTIDVAMQRQLEQILKTGLDNAKSKSGGALIVDPKSGQIKAIANYPSYDPAKFNEVSDTLLFTNPIVSSPLEPGSIMKPLTTAAALDSGSVTSQQTYYDPSFFKVDDAVVKNIEEDGGAATRSVSDILRLSLNTGATWLLMQMGGGELNEKGRSTWHDYMVNHYQFSKKTGIEQGYEEPGLVPDPKEGYGLNIRYANTSFGQGMTATPLQMAMAVTSIVNGGTYYQPTLISGSSTNQTDFSVSEPKVVKNDVVSSEVSKTIVEFMQTVVKGNSVTSKFAREGYIIGGKTGTAEIARPEGGYYEDRFNGTYVGFVGGDEVEYVILVRVDDPKIAGYAGSQAAGPIFGSLVNMLIDNFSVQSVSR
jgi:cell division protein FtsI/penicillin-binding protein 2